MTIQLHQSKIASSTQLVITGSKSESNRLLLLQALYPSLRIENISNSDDSKVMAKAFEENSGIVDVHHAGTAMRFLTAYFAVQPDNDVVLTGSKRMKERPIKILVDALNILGADITYTENEGCPPLQIKGQKISKSEVTLKANVSSQYISALLLVAPKLQNGLTLHLEGQITSIPYIKMTLDLLNQIGVETSFEGHRIKIFPLQSLTEHKTIAVESDWSSASYFYSIVAMSDIGTEITLSNYRKNSLQGDSVLAEIYEDFGVRTEFSNQTIKLSKIAEDGGDKAYDLITSPDIAQTIAVTCLGMGLKCDLTGLHTLKIKETDRLLALKNEMQKFGGIVEVSDHSLHLSAANQLQSGVTVSTYNDHRMAMAFAPLALKTDFYVEDAMVVSKSYPTFWDDLKSIGFKISS